MEDNLDNLIISDWERSIGFSSEDPLTVSMEGVEVPTDTSVGAYAEGVGRTWGEMLRGAIAGTLGGVGDVESIIGGIKNVFEKEAGEGSWDAFLAGMAEPTTFPTARQVSEAMPQIPGNEDQKFAGQIGEILGPGGVINAARTALKKAPKAAGASVAVIPASPDVQAATAQEFNQALADQMETWHGGLAVPTADAREANKPEAQRSKDIGFGHKITKAEEKSGTIYGIPFKDAQGNYIEISEADGLKILEADMQKNVAAARKHWDVKLANIATSWDQLEEPYRQALSSLAYNVGGTKAGKSWTDVLKAAADQDVQRFAKEMRRKDNRKYTAGMDNRVAKELYYAGIIKGLRDVQNELPLADANVAGIPQ
jgi:GH24 family phage-related lysozyme (muramidase)